MIKKFFILTMATLSFVASVHANPNYAETQIAQKAQLIQYIEQQERSLEEENNKFNLLSESLSNIKKEGKLYSILLPWTTLSALGGTAAVGIATKAYHKSTLSKVSLYVGGVVLIVSVIGSVGSNVRVSLMEPEIEHIKRQMEIATANLDAKRAGLVALKKDIGIESKNIGINNNTGGATTAVTGQ